MTTDGDSGDRAARFRVLVSDLRRLRDARDGDEDARERERGHRFGSLTTTLRPRLIARIRANQIRVDSWLRNKLPAPAPFDMFEALGISGREASYTAALAWMLSHASSGFAFEIASAMLAHIHWGGTPPPRTVGPLLSATTEVTTVDGRVDLLVEFDDFALVIETKVWTDEHATPSGRQQSESYVDSVGALLKQRGRAKPVHAVLLTPDGRLPANPDAGALGFLPLAVAILDTDGCKERDPLGVLTQLYAEHLLETAAAASGGSLRRIRRLSLDPGSDDALLQEAPNLSVLARIIQGGAS